MKKTLMALLGLVMGLGLFAANESEVVTDGIGEYSGSYITLPDGYELVGPTGCVVNPTSRLRLAVTPTATRPEPAKNVLVWVPSYDSGSSSMTTYVQHVCSMLKYAYESVIPGKDAYKAKYPSGIVVDYFLGSKSSPIDLPASLDSYALVFVVVPYVDVTESQADKLKTVMARGGRLVLQGENGGFAAYENVKLTNIAKYLGADFQINSGKGSGSDTYNTSSDLLKGGLTSYPQSDLVAPISYSGVAQKIAHLVDSSTMYVWAVDEVSGNGRITVFSDWNWYYSRSGSSPILHEAAVPLLERLLANAIECEQKVIDEENPNEGIEEEIPEGMVAAVQDNNGLLTYYRTVTSACAAAKPNGFTVLLKKDIDESFELPVGVTFVTTGITTNYQGVVSAPIGYEVKINETHDIYKVEAVPTPETPVVTASDGTYSDKVRITWNKPASVRPITAYELVRVKDGSTLEVLLANNLTVTEFDDTTATPETVYTYYVRAKSDAGWGWRGSDTGYMSERPPVVTSLAIEGPATLDSGATGNYRAIATYADGSTKDVTVAAATAWSVNPTTGATIVKGAAAANLTPNKGVTSLTLKADYSEVGEGVGTIKVSATKTITVLLKVPEKVPSVSATTGSSTDRITVTWTVPASDSPITGYDIVRVDKDGNRVTVATDVTGTTFEDTTATPGADYTYEVSAKSEAGKGEAGKSNAGWRKIALSVSPSSLSYDFNGGTKAVTVTSASDWTVFAKSGVVSTATKSSATQASVTVSKNADRTAKTGSVTITAGASTAHPETATVTVTQGEHPKYVTKIDVVSGPSSLEGGESGDYTVVATFDDGTTKDVTKDATWTITSGGSLGSIGAHTGHLTTLSTTKTGTIVIGVTYVDPLDPSITTTTSKSVAIEITLVPPSAPATISATDGSSSDNVTITWSAASSRKPVSAYELSRAVKGTSAWTTLSSSLATSFVDNTTTPGVDYTYRVRAKNDAGWGAYASDNGWRKISLAVDPTEIEAVAAGKTQAVAVSSSVEWAIAATSGEVSATKASTTKLNVTVPANETFESRSASVMVKAGASTAHPETATITVSQAKRPKRLVSLSIDGASAGTIGANAEYRAFVTYDDDTAEDVTVADGSIWTCDTMMPQADFVRVGSVMRLIPHAPGLTITLKATYSAECGTISGGVETMSVSATKTVMVPAAISLPIAVDAETREFTVGTSVAGGNLWYGQSEVSEDGIDAAQSGYLAGAGETWFETVVTNAGDIAFSWKASCEATYDKLSFSIDGVTKATMTGVDNEWKRLAFEIGSGSHTLRWTYSKDEKGNEGADAAWVDRVVWTPLAVPSTAVVTAADGASSDNVEITWTASDSKRPVKSYELSRALVGSGDWEVLVEGNVFSFVDTSAEPGVDYTYRVRAENEAGWSEYGRDNGWRAFAVTTDPEELTLESIADEKTVIVTANAEWSLAEACDWLAAEKIDATAFKVLGDKNESLDPRESSVTIKVGGASAHAIEVELPIMQLGRPARLDVGFIKPYEDWRTKLQIVTNSIPADVYSPVSVFTRGEPLAIGFGWTNRSEIAVSVPAVRFRILDAEANLVTEWTEPERTGERLDVGKGDASGNWTCDAIRILTPGNYQLEAEIGPADLFEDINRVDNKAIFRFAVRDPILDAFRDVFTEEGWTNIEFKVGNDFAQAPHVASMTTEAGATTGIQFGPYVPMNGVIGRGTTGKAPLDLIFLVDFTGSMGGCIDGLKENIKEFFKSLVEGDAEHAPITDWRAKVVGYQDITCDRVWYWDDEFTSDVSKFNTEVNKLYADNGGDWEESLLDAIWKIAKETEFREEATRVVVAFTDAAYKTPMTYPSRVGSSDRTAVDAGRAAADAGIILKLISSYNNAAHFNALVSNCYSTNSTYTVVSSLSSFTGNAEALRALAGEVSSSVKEAEVVEPMLSVNTAGRGTLTFDWCNDSTAVENNTFTFVCDTDPNRYNVAGTGWEHVELELAEGWHSFKWMYGKRDYAGAIVDAGMLANLTWKPYETELTVKPSVREVKDPEGEQDVTFEVECNSTWKVVEHDDWISVVRGSGDGDGELIVNVSTNMAYSKRTGKIVVRAGEYGLPTDKILEREVHVMQEAHPYVEDGKPHVLSVDVKPRWPWNRKVDIDFRVVVPREGVPVTVRLTGINNEGEGVVEDFGYLKAMRECKPASAANITTGFGFDPDPKKSINADLSFNCPTSGLYRVTWDMALDWYNLAISIPAKGSAYAKGQPTWFRQVTEESSFHTPAFSVRVSATSGAAVSDMTSRNVRVDCRVGNASETVCNDPTQNSNGYSGGAIMTGTELIGHPLGLVDPVWIDTTSRSIFPNEGWNALDFVEDLVSIYSNRTEFACVINRDDVVIEGGCVLTTNATWGADKVHVLRDNLFIARDAKLTIAPDAVVKVCRDAHIYVYDGATNLELQGCFIAEAFDSLYGGDVLYHSNNQMWQGGKMVVFTEAYEGDIRVSGDSIVTISKASIVKVKLTSYLKTDGVKPVKKDFKDRFYSKGQPWGELPRPSESGYSFYGWYATDPTKINGWSDIDPTKYEASKTKWLDMSSPPCKIGATSATYEVYALVCDSAWGAKCGSEPSKKDGSHGVVTITPTTVVYDAKEHRPAVKEVRVSDAKIAPENYEASYGVGDYRSVGKYEVGVDFLVDYEGSPKTTFEILPRSTEGGELILTPSSRMYNRNAAGVIDVTNPAASVKLPEMGEAPTSDYSLNWIDPFTGKVGRYRVEARMNGNYYGATITNVFEITVNPDYVYREYATSAEAVAGMKAGQRILRIAGPVGDAFVKYVKNLIQTDTDLNDYVIDNYVCWADDVSVDRPALLEVYGEKDLTKPLLSHEGYIENAELWAFLREGLTAKEDASSATLTLSKTSFVYTGSAQKPSVTVSFGGATVSSANYDLVWSGDCIAVGAYDVKAVFKGAYKGETAAASFTITPATIASTAVTLTPTSAVYSGLVQRPIVNVTGAKDYAVDYGAGDYASVGDYVVSVEVSGNYTGTIAKNYSITRKPISATIELDSTRMEVKPSKPLTEPVKPIVKRVYDATRTYVEGVDYTLAYGAGDWMKPGSYTITATFLSPYQGTATATFEIVEVEEAPEAVEVKPGEGSVEVEAGSKEEAVEKVVISVPTEVSGKVTIEAEKYRSYFEIKAEFNPATGKYEVTAELKAEVVLPTTEEGEAPEAVVLDAILSGETPTIAAVPGLYYTLQGSSNLRDFIGTPVLATGKTVELKRPSLTGSSAFFKIRVSATDK